MTSLTTIVTREELRVLRGLEHQFLDQWIKEGRDGIPQIPHLPNLGRGIKFHLPSVDAWLLRHFQVGGIETPKSAASTR